MKKKIRSRVAGLVVIAGFAAYFYSSLVPPLELQIQKTSAVHTMLSAENTGFLSMKIEAFYINNNEVPPEALMNIKDSWRPVRGQKVSAGQKKNIGILHDLPVKQIVIVYKYAGIPYTRTYPVKDSGKGGF
ncbi:hypothetical protein [Fictibacillus fluitans]|uniref:Uncharacterized protein n=1 Tax=Fictibacillus fluitans TaxID=3058422 RepID=A0ABT8HU75_9BACL|nr:hypothetical protein [Fictibacillus sp. NE201]MDN4524323.1 hypothetical protein [Fictibacillus sp. NE201]